MLIQDVETDENDAFRQSIRSYLERHQTVESLRTTIAEEKGFDASAWRAMGESLGLAGLRVPEAYGGSDASLGSIATAFEVLGYALAPSPMLSIVLASELLTHSSDLDAQAAWLPAIAAGACVATVAIVEAENPRSWASEEVATAAVLHGDEWRLSGAKTFVTDGATAQLIVVTARTSVGVSVFAVEPPAAGLTVTALVTLDLTRAQAEVRFRDTPARLIASHIDAQTALARMSHLAVTALVAEQVGMAEYLLSRTVEYAKQREQFGQPIGSFQAIKHKIADMAFDLERMRSALSGLLAASGDLEMDSPPVIEASLAKSFCSEAVFRIAADCIQVHGGIGFTWEHPAHLYLRRAVSTGMLFGDSEYHRGCLSSKIGL